MHVVNYASNSRVGVGLAIVHETSDGSSNYNEHSNHDSCNCSGGKFVVLGGNDQLSLLGTIREVVVTSRHVCELSSLVHFNESSIEVGGRGSIELSTVGKELFDVVDVVSILGKQGLDGNASSLVDERHAVAEELAIEKRLFNSVIGSDDGDVVIQVLDLHDVGTISLHCSFTIIASGIVVTTSPLEVNNISLLYLQAIWYEVVLRRRESLHDVSTFSADVQVVNLGVLGHSLGSGVDVEDVRTVLEGTSELGGVDG